MDALILAAGQGSRLKEGRAKCLVDVGGRPLIHHTVDALRSAGVERFVAAGGEGSWLPASIAAIAPEHPVACLDVAGLPWVEIDFPEDLAHARAHVLPALTGALASAA